MPDLITPSKSALDVGTIFTQIGTFSGTKTIDKISLNLSTTTADLQSLIIGSEGVVSFQSANFRESRDSWVFQPMIHWLSSNNWETSGTTIQNTLQFENYEDTDDAALNAPFIKYDLFLDLPGVYELWGLGFTSSEGVFWSWDEDTTHMRRFTLGDPAGPPVWTKFGVINSPAGGQHSFSVYLSDAANVVLDQWYFTQDTYFEQTIPVLQNGEFSVLPLSKAPFNTALRARSLDGNNLDSLSSPISGSASITSWVSSKTIAASGVFNYPLQDNSSGRGVSYSNGLSIDYWQLGGSSNHMASWDFIFSDNSAGDAFISTDFGQTFTNM